LLLNHRRFDRPSYANKRWPSPQAQIGTRKDGKGREKARKKKKRQNLGRRKNPTGRRRVGKRSAGIKNESQKNQRKKHNLIRERLAAAEN